MAACATSPSKSPTASTGRLQVVAAEDFWGSLARQLGGSHVQVQSLIANPATDPHDYEPTPADGRAIASADLVLTNGIGYDSWIDRLIAANRSSARKVLKVGDLVGLEAGDNPHQWYSPDAVDKVIAAITDQYKSLDASHAADYDSQRRAYENTALSGYRSAIADIRATYSGTPVGASESLFTPLASALGLRLLTPPSFLNAVAEGSDPTAADKATVDRQIATKAISLFVFNRQNSTPDVERLVGAANAAGIPVATITETLTPQGGTFQDWQTRQLHAIAASLAAAGARASAK